MLGFTQFTMMGIIKLKEGIKFKESVNGEYCVISIKVSQPGRKTPVTFFVSFWEEEIIEFIRNNFGAGDCILVTGEITQYYTANSKAGFRGSSIGFAGQKIRKCIAGLKESPKKTKDKKDKEE